MIHFHPVITDPPYVQRQGAVDEGLVHMNSGSISTPAPVFIDHCLDNEQVFGIDFAVSDDLLFHKPLYRRNLNGTPALNEKK